MKAPKPSKNGGHLDSPQSLADNRVTGSRMPYSCFLGWNFHAIGVRGLTLETFGRWFPDHRP